MCSISVVYIQISERVQRKVTQIIIMALFSATMSLLWLPIQCHMTVIINWTYMLNQQIPVSEGVAEKIDHYGDTDIKKR